MTKVATKLDKHGFILRSGGAPGCDTAFELGVLRPFMKDIYLPWKGFNNNSSSHYLRKPDLSAELIASSVHPEWKNCNGTSRKFHTRNVYQVLGPTLRIQSDFVLFYADEINGQVQGGTATAVNIARYCNIPTFNFKDENVLDYFQKFTNV